MNFMQMGVFFVFLISTFSAGAGIFCFLFQSRERDALARSRFILGGEIFALGSMLLVGEFLALSMLHLYKKEFLWLTAGANILWLLRADVRHFIRDSFAKRIHWTLPLIVFCFFAGVFIYRNSYFLVDTDSHSSYLFAQKMWLEKGTSVFAGKEFDLRIYVPHFDAVPYSLGLSVFPQETLYCQMINMFWRLLAVFLVFGYLRYRLNDYSALAGVFFLIFNEHFLYSGANQWVLINGAVIAFLFAAAYNLWESYQQKSTFRFILAFIFISQLMANKYQMAYNVLFLGFLGIVLRWGQGGRWKEIFLERRTLGILFLAAGCCSFWFIKNFIATGSPLFPIWGSHVTQLGFSAAKEKAFVAVLGGVAPGTFIKYMNYFFIWPGISAAKVNILLISFLPVLIFFGAVRKRLELEDLLELSFWLACSTFIIMGIAIASHQDPRYFRYGIAVYSCAAVLGLEFLFRRILAIKQRWLVNIIVLVVAFSGFKVLFWQGGSFYIPSYKDNFNVLSNRLKVDEVMEKHYPMNVIALKGIEAHSDKFLKSAWDRGKAGESRLSSFWLPFRPQISLWLTSIIGWESYSEKQKIIKDLKDFGLEWVMDVRDGELVFQTLEEFSEKALLYERYPKEILYDYDFPPELSRARY